MTGAWTQKPDGKTGYMSDFSVKAVFFEYAVLFGATIRTVALVSFMGVPCKEDL